MEFPVSVVIPTYNRVDFLPFAINSALEQTLPPIEVVVVDDASTDATPAWMETQYGRHSKVRYVRLPENRGPGFARAYGAERASGGGVLAFLDSDDVWRPNHLEAAFKAWSGNSDLVAILAQRGEIDIQGRVARETVPETWSGEFLEVLLKRIIFHPSRLVVCRSVWAEINERIPTTAPPLRFVEDYVFGAALAHLYGKRVAVLADRTVWMRRHEGQSYRNALQLKENLQAAVDTLVSAFPEIQPYRAVVTAANLCHAAYFLWRSGNQRTGWATLMEAVRCCPRIVRFSDFGVAFSRLLIPPGVRRVLRRT